MSIYLRLLSYTKKYYRHIMLTIACSILFSFLNGASVYLTIPLLDTLFQETNSKQVVTQQALPSSVENIGFISKIKKNISESFDSYVLRGSKSESLIRICILVMLTFLLKNVVGYFQAYFLTFVEQGTVRDIRDDAFAHLHQLPISFFKNERTGNLISNITNDVNVMQGSISASFLNMVREPLSIIVFMGLALSISWRLTLFAFIILPISLGIISWLGLKLRKQVTFVQEKMGDITNVLQETITGVKIVKAFGMEDYETNKFKSETESYFQLMLRITRVRNLSQPMTETLSVLIGVVIIYKGGSMVLQDHTLKASEFLGFLFAIFQMMPPIKELSGVNNRIQEASAAGARVFALIDAPPSIGNSLNPARVKSFEQNISFTNVTYQYEDAEEPVLSDVSFSVGKGEVVAFVGPSGGGKSTLVDLLPRFYDVTGGSINIDGVDIRDIEIGDLRGLMGIVTQETILFNESISSNIAYGLIDTSEEVIIRAAKMANAHNFIMEFPDQYRTMIGERGVKLSGGQRQRLSIARALLKNPQVMIFDEATSALDSLTEEEINDTVRNVSENKEHITILIAHRLSTVMHADKIFVLEKGTIIESGRHEELLQLNGLYYAMWRQQIGERKSEKTLPA